MHTEHSLSIRRNRLAVGLSRSVYGYQHKRAHNDQPIINALLALVDKFPSYSFRKLHVMLRKQGHELC